MCESLTLSKYYYCDTGTSTGTVPFVFEDEHLVIFTWDRTVRTWYVPVQKDLYLFKFNICAPFVTEMYSIVHCTYGDGTD